MRHHLVQQKHRAGIALDRLHPRVRQNQSDQQRLLLAGGTIGRRTAPAFVFDIKVRPVWAVSRASDLAISAAGILERLLQSILGIQRRSFGEPGFGLAFDRQVGGRDYIHVVSAYRSPETNKMLRRTRGGQAKKSQHMYGRAMDFFIPGVKLSKLRAVAMKLQGGGVGYYPRSGSPFVHLDVAGVRAWPRMSRKELVRLFPDGKTLHLPADGKPLKGYQQALAEAKRRKGRPVIIDDKPSGSGSDGGKSLLASL